MELQPYPVDFTKLDKGGVIPPDVVDRIVVHPRGTPEHGFARMRLRLEVERELAYRGLAVTVVDRDSALVVLTDAEASIYNRQQAHLGLAKTLRAFERLVHVDRSKLTAEQRDEHDTSVDHTARYVQAIAATRKQIALLPHRSNVPGAING